MKRRYPSHLRLHVEDSIHANEPSTAARSNFLSGIEYDEVQGVLAAFTQATNWSVHELTGSEASKSKGKQSAADKKGNRWRLIETIVQDGVLDVGEMDDLPLVSMNRAQQLLSSIEKLVNRLEIAEETVRQQGAELATAVGVTSHSDRQRETADRLESILDSVCRSIGAVAGAIYLLDDETTTLKLRSCIGLPSNRLTAPPRELRGSLADLEALLGNAVLLSDIEMMREWPSPEPFASALVVPIGSTTMPHGTMWFWSDKTRSYSATEIEVANLAAGRVMSEIEHSILGQEIHQSRAIQKQLDAASLTQASMLPDSQVLHEDFDVNGWTYQNDGIGGGFHHWDVNPQEMMTLALGNANQRGPDGALVATGIQSIMRSMWSRGGNPASILRSMNDTMWAIQETDWTASTGLIQINPKTGYGTMCLAGDIQSFIVSYRGFRPIGTQNPKVGQFPDTTFNVNRFYLQPGEILLAFTSGVLAPSPNRICSKGVTQNKPVMYPTLDQNALLQIVRDMSDEKAGDITGFLARTLPTFDRDQSTGLDRSLILIKNVRKAVR